MEVSIILTFIIIYLASLNVHEGKVTLEAMLDNTLSQHSLYALQGNPTHGKPKRLNSADIFR